jgi:hypothetical protein
LARGRPVTTPVGHDIFQRAGWDALADVGLDVEYFLGMQTDFNHGTDFELLHAN